ETTVIDRDDFTSSRSWDGEKPPLSRFLDSPTFVRRDDGIWCRRDAISRLYPVHAYGDRCSKPKVFHTPSGKYRDQRRPEEVSSHVWWEMMNKEERRQWWRDHPDIRLADDSFPSIRCHPLGIEALIDNVPPIT
ncbi:MAG: hypothetical protein ACKPKO_41645, partial [Candidatus Fonsibacter sp.]